MILSDLDGVLAMGPGRDTSPGDMIYRTFSEVPRGLLQARNQGVPLHLVTAKVEGEARQVLAAVGLETHFASVIGADRLFWTTLRRALHTLRMPSAVFKSGYRSFIKAPGYQPIVMIEDNRNNLLEMLASGAIDYGILLPPIRIEEGLVVRGFDLGLALDLASHLATGNQTLEAFSEVEVSRLREPRRGETQSQESVSSCAHSEPGRYIFHLPPLIHQGSTKPPIPLESLSTGVRLVADHRSVISAVRGARRLARVTLKRMGIR